MVGIKSEVAEQMIFLPIIIIVNINNTFNCQMTSKN